MSDTSAEQAAKAYAFERVPLDAQIDAEAPFWRIEIELAYERGARWQRERPVSEAEVEAAMREFVGEPPYSDYYETGGDVNLAWGAMRAALEAARRVGDGNE